MDLLFIHHSYPGQFATLLDALLRTGGHRIVFITHADRMPPPRPGLTVVPYLFPPTSFRTHTHARHFDEAMRRAAAVAEVATGLHAAGFTPDLILGHEGWGDTLGLVDVWPAAPQIGFREYFYREHGADIGADPEFPVAPAQYAGVRARNAPLLLALLQGHQGVSPTEWQRGLYPEWARPRIHQVDDAVDLAACHPDPALRTRPFALGLMRLAPGDTLVTFTASSLEPYRGLHVLMRALPALLARPRLHVACFGATAPLYGLPPRSGTWWDTLRAELGPGIDHIRLHGPGMLPYADHLRLLRRSDVHLYLSYPFIVSWSLREALATGCAVVAADTEPVRAFVDPGRTGLLVQPLNPGATAAAVLALLDDPPQRARLGRAARLWAEQALRPERHVAEWRRLITEVCGRDPFG